MRLWVVGQLRNQAFGYYAAVLEVDYSVVVAISLSRFTIVEADSREMALDKAEKLFTECSRCQ